MSDECCVVTGTSADEVRRPAVLRPLCPENGKAGRRVDVLTVKALLAHPLDILRRGDYFFCPDETCSVVYYHASGQVFRESDLRERVYQKHPQDADVLVCYCFQHTRQAIFDDARSGEKSRLPEAITAGVKAGQCACEVRNPQGSCCLGNVRAEAKRAVQSNSF